RELLLQIAKRRKVIVRRFTCFQFCSLAMTTAATTVESTPTLQTATTTVEAATTAVEAAATTVESTPTTMKAFAMECVTALAVEAGSSMHVSLPVSVSAAITMAMEVAAIAIHKP